MNVRSIGKKLRHYFASAEAYKLLDRYPETRGSTWVAGGCWVGAEALHWALPNSEIWTVIDQGIPHHVVVRYRGYFLDADGASTESELIERWRRVEGLHRPELVRGLRADTGLVCPVKAVRELRKALGRLLE